MIHPTLLKYAELYCPNGDKKELLNVAREARSFILNSFEDQVEIDCINWLSMVQVIGDPNINEHNFGCVYEDGWDGEYYLFETLRQLTIDPDFSGKKLEDYL